MLVKPRWATPSLHLTQHFSVAAVYFAQTADCDVAVHHHRSTTVGVVRRAGHRWRRWQPPIRRSMPLLAAHDPVPVFAILQLRQSRRLLAGERSLRDDDGQSAKTISVIQIIVALVGLGMVLLMTLFPALTVCSLVEADAGCRVRRKYRETGARLLGVKNAGSGERNAEGIRLVDAGSPGTRASDQIFGSQRRAWMSLSLALFDQTDSHPP